MPLEQALWNTEHNTKPRRDHARRRCKRCGDRYLWRDNTRLCIPCKKILRDEKEQRDLCEKCHKHAKSNPTGKYCWDCKPL